MTQYINHRDFAGCGVAVPDNINRFRFETLLEIGANAWRMRFIFISL